MIFVGKSKKIRKMKTIVVEEAVKEKKSTNPIVYSPSRFVTVRLGKGFSLKEIKNAAVPLDEVMKLNLPIDYRRKSVHQPSFLSCKKS